MSNDDLLSNFDRLVEQQDQEITHYGAVSPATQQALQNLTEQDYIPGPAPKRDWSQFNARLRDMRAEREQEQDPSWFDWDDE